MTAQPATTTVVNTLLECAQGKQDPEVNIWLAENAVDSELSRLSTDSSYTDKLLQIVFPTGQPAHRKPTHTHLLIRHTHRSRS